MEAHSPPPSKIARFADTAGMMKKEKSSPPSLGLDLGLGSGLNQDGKSCFTFLQLQELEHQSLIYKHMAAGVPVPFNLVLPIWKSLASSYGALCNGSGVYPSFLGCKGVYFDYKNSMEPEPGRCRRTDGKKWRCSKDVVPDQKYCERHMHRGRNRSRKPVEIVSQVGSSSSNNNNNNNNISTSNTNLSISIPLQLMATTPSTANTTTSTTTTLDFSPKSVLQNGGTCKNEHPL